MELFLSMNELITVGVWTFYQTSEKNVLNNYTIKYHEDSSCNKYDESLTYVEAVEGGFIKTHGSG